MVQTTKRRGWALRIPALYTGSFWVWVFTRSPIILAKRFRGFAYLLLAANSWDRPSK